MEEEEELEQEQELEQVQRCVRNVMEHLETEKTGRERKSARKPTKRKAKLNAEAIVLANGPEDT